MSNKLTVHVILIIDNKTTKTKVLLHIFKFFYYHDVRQPEIYNKK